MMRSARKATANLLAETAHQHHLKSRPRDDIWHDPGTTMTALDELRRTTHGLIATIALTLAATIRPRTRP